MSAHEQRMKVTPGCNDRNNNDNSDNKYRLVCFFQFIELKRCFKRMYFSYYALYFKNMIG